MMITGIVAVAVTISFAYLRALAVIVRFQHSKTDAFVQLSINRLQKCTCHFCPDLQVNKATFESYSWTKQTSGIRKRTEFEAQERMKQQMMIEKISLPTNVSHGIVRSYLLHYGYEDTLNSFDMASKSTVPPVYIAQENGFDEQDILYALNQRNTLRQLVRNGEIDSALVKLREWYPQIVQDDKSATCFLLHCQKFIELVRVGSLEEAVKYGRIELAKFFGLPVFKEIVQDCVALLAYVRPRESSVGYLLEESQREVVADTVNAMILSTNPNLKDSNSFLHSYLERLLRQLTACSLERRSLSGDQGEAFHLHRVLNSCKKARLGAS
ncbi:putative transcription factor interactor and regulator LisH family [Rosa chinensis]|uniref:Putative transcription factor interactor and regulator LisH family n=1 Tax=Rosa chinensis TaxID=74649 RepID=A0A2P6PEW0_ROSCH|nr:putative transcription factor interactor and regulator LisH family [Rosa chinensis]